ncbi:hypothetical protein QQF64_015799 [Cirrhinus molitorella]|uniref:Uncharacterized protein n=1 Tax=Cirrhinus molitorella TaxID=172907 RepID=A0ABR3LML9_9TELE
MIPITQKQQNCDITQSTDHISCQNNLQADGIRHILNQVRLTGSRKPEQPQTHLQLKTHSALWISDPAAKDLKIHRLHALKNHQEHPKAFSVRQEEHALPSTRSSSTR